jgi:hypothetical protein
MPVMDGVQEILRIRMTNPGAKFICMTGDSADCCPEGVVLLSKPFSIEKLLQAVDGVLRPWAVWRKDCPIQLIEPVGGSSTPGYSARIKPERLISFCSRQVHSEFQSLIR